MTALDLATRLLCAAHDEWNISEESRALAADALAALTAAEAAARGAAMLRAQVDALTARVVDAEAEAARRTDEVVAIGAALGRTTPATAQECVALIGLIGRTCARLTDERNEAVRALDEARRPTMEPHP